MKAERTSAHEQMVAMNEALMLGSVRQHELTEAAENLNAQLHVEITERKQAEEVLRRRTAQFETLLNEAPLGVYVVDGDFRFCAINPTARSVFGDIPDVIGRDFDEVVRILWPKAYADEIVGRLRHTLESGEPYIVPERGEERIDRGVTEFYEWQLNRIPLPEGRYGVVCYFRDISERFLAQQKIRESEERFRTLFASAPMAVFVCDRNAVIQHYNQRAVELWGREPVCGAEQHCGSVKLCLPDGTRLPHAQSPMVEVLRTGNAAHNVEVFIERPDGSRLPVLMNFAALKNAQGEITGAITSFMDITERKQAEEMLRRNEALFSALVEQAPVGVYVVDGQLRLLQVNPKARHVFSKVHPLIGRNFSEIMQVIWPRRVADQIAERFRHTLKTGAPYQSLDFAERRRDIGVKEFYEWQIQRVTLPAGEYGVVCFFSNMTERKRAEGAQRRLDVLTASNRKLKQEIVRRQAVEKALKKSEQHQSGLLEESRQMQEQLRHLSHQILQAQEEERKRISRELHDVITQTLVGINVRLAALTGEAAGNLRGLQQKIARTQRLVEKSVDIVHRFARELRPTALDDLGLIPALNSFAKSFAKRTRLRIRLTVFAAVEELDNAKRTVLFRVAQEALTNVAKHAQATRVEVNIQKLPAAVRMEIKDNGKSFQLQRALHARRHNRLGLLGMRERVEMVGGKFTIESTSGKGTTVRAELPLSNGGVRGEGRKTH